MSPANVSSPRLREIENRLEELSRVDLSHSQRYGEADIAHHSFEGWASYAQSVRDPDRARNALYYGFQPLYDCLVSDDLPDSGRRLALDALNHLIDAGVSFLTGYYSGKPDVKVLKDTAKQLKPSFEELNGTRYRTKFRNIDYYSGLSRPEDVLSFLRQFLEYSLDGKIFVPDYVIGCACGSSEVAMPLAGLVSSKIGFIRRSKRRGDAYAKLIQEHEDEIRQNVSGSRVVCVEDFVCTGGSLLSVMEKASEYKPLEIKGVSLHRNGDYGFGSGLKQEVDSRTFNLFRHR